MSDKQTSKKVLAFGAHPDDVEFGCAGTLLILKEKGYTIEIIDLTRGEKAKYGAENRLKEAKKAADILQIPRRVLDFGDKNISLTDNIRQQISEIIKEENPSFVFAPYIKDDHTDHEKTGKLLSSLAPTVHYFISTVQEPNHGVDITGSYQVKREALMAHESQIRPGDISWFENRHRKYGQAMAVKWGELFYYDDTITFSDIFREITPEDFSEEI